MIYLIILRRILKLWSEKEEENTEFVKYMSKKIGLG